MFNVLVVDDNQVDRERLRRLLRDHTRIVEASTAGEGVHIAGSEPFDCVLLDYRLPDSDGTDVIGMFRERGLPVLMITSQGSDVVAVEAMKQGAHDYIDKGHLEAGQLRGAIDAAIERHRLQLSVARHREELERTVAELEAKKGELERTNRALATSETKMRVLLEQLPAIAWVAGPDLTLRTMCGAGLKSAGVVQVPPRGTPLLSQSALIGHGAEALEAHRQALLGERARYRVRVRDHTFECSVEPLHDEAARTTGVIGVAFDVTDVIRLEQRLAHAAKMEAIGMLAGGLAHDFNNLLTAVVGFTDFALERLPEGSPTRGDLTEALTAAGRAVELVRQLLAFARRDVTSVATDVEVGDCTARLLPMLRRLLREDVEIDFEPPPSMWTHIDRRALEQVLVNLAVNARDAMPAGGPIRIRIVPRTLEGGVVGAGGKPLHGQFVELSVSDEGIGIPAAVVDRIFEPFFTTKPAGYGTGLGLSTCYGLVQKAGGSIVVESRPGATTFRVLLPRVEAPEAAEGERVHAAPRGTETILLVEDDPRVRAVTARMLRHLGYVVLTAAGGEAALDLAFFHPGTIDAVLSDVIMPEMDGPTTVARLREVRPELKSLFISGGLDHASRPQLPPGALLVEKPPMLEDLATKLREVLDPPGR